MDSFIIEEATTGNDKKIVKKGSLEKLRSDVMSINMFSTVY
jgi:hypothetical protein